MTSRIALVESSRAFHRLRASGTVDESRLGDAERDVEMLWARCEIWEVGRAVRELVRSIAPRANLRTLGANHLATFVLARSRLGALDLMTTDERLERAAETV